MTLKNYLGANGIVTQELSEIREDLIEKFQSIYGTDVNLDQNTPDGQWLNILAQEKKDLLDMLVSIYNSFDVDTVIGLPQQILYKLNGLKIKAYTFSYCYVDVTVTSSVTLSGLDDNIENESGTGFTVSDTAGNEWILAETSDLTVGTHTLNFRSQNIGSVTALANTITNMVTVIAGVSSVNNNDNNYVTGSTGESSAEFRERRNKTIALASQGFCESIESALLNLDNVTQAKVYDNKEDTTSEGIPAHSVWVIVEGGASEDIGRTIYSNLPPGINMYGDEEVTINRDDSELDRGTVTVKYDLPEPVTLYVQGKIKKIGDSVIDESYLKKQLATTNFNIGESAQSSNIVQILKDLVAESGNPYEITVAIDTGEEEMEYTSYLTPTGKNEYFVITTDSISLTVVE